MRIVLPALMLLALSSCAMMTGAKPEPTYVVFFTERSTAIDDAGHKVIADAAREAKAGSKPVTVLGFTDSAGSASADQTLSEARADSVSQALVADGVTSETIRREGRGQTHEDPGVASRRVEIAVGN